jgi:cyclase
MGDLLFVNTHPYLASGSPKQWKQSLAKVEALGVKTVVPGHGSVGKSTDLSVMLQYIQSLENIVVNMIESGKSAEQASFEPVPSPFDTWLCFEDFFFANLKFLHKLATHEEESK